MRTNRVRVLFGALLVLLALVFCAGAALGEDASRFTVEDGVLVYVSDVAEGENLVIPEYVDGQRITAIGEQVFWSAQMASVSLPSSVTSIGDHAFYWCSNLTSINIPSGVTSIGDYAFDSCAKLDTLTLPAGVQSTGESSFHAFTDLLVSRTSTTALTVTGSGFDFIDPQYPNIYLYAYQSGSTRTYAVTRCDADATSISFPSGVTEIADHALNGNDNLISVTIPSTVKRIGEYAFYDCDNLSSVTIAAGLEEIDTKAFSWCPSLKSLTLPSGLKTIGTEAFYYSQQLESINIPSTVTSIGTYAFIQTGLEGLTLPDNVTSMGESILNWNYDLTTSRTGNTALLLGEQGRSFVDPQYPMLEMLAGKDSAGNRTLSIIDCDDSVTSITLPSGVTAINTGAFGNCTQLTSITLPSTLKTIGESAFSNCSALTGIVIPSGVTEIKPWAFYQCTALTSVTLPSTLTVIGEHAFYDCEELTEVTLPSGLKSIGESAFSYTGIQSVTVPSGVTEIGANPFGWYAKMYADRNSTVALLISENDDHFVDPKYPGLFLIAQEDASGNRTFIVDLCDDYATSVTFPSGVTEISAYAFSSCSDLTSITIPSTVKTIGSYAFRYCSGLTDLVIPNTVTTVGECLVESCSKLKNLTIPDCMTIPQDELNTYFGVTVTLGKNNPSKQMLIDNGVAVKIRETGETFNILAGEATTVAKKVDEIVDALIRPGMSDYQKALVLHNWIINNANYDTTYSRYDGSDILLQGSGVCQAYMEAYELLLDEVGIPNTREHGDNHVWNMIKLDGEWYHVDCTWDDPIDGWTGEGGGLECWDFFCVSNYALEGVDSHECYNKPYIANGYKYNYAYRTGQLDELLDECRTTIADNLMACEYDFEFNPWAVAGDYHDMGYCTAALVLEDETFTVDGVTYDLSIYYDKSQEVYQVETNGLGKPAMNLPGAMKVIGTAAFEDSDVRVVVLPDGATTIGARAFANCDSLRQIQIPATVTSIDATAFAGVTKLCIFGETGSTAESFANANGFAFCVIE